MTDQIAEHIPVELRGRFPSAEWVEVKRCDGMFCCAAVIEGRLRKAEVRWSLHSPQEEDRLIAQLAEQLGSRPFGPRVPKPDAISDLRERIESAIRRHLDWPESENLTGPIADDIMREIEQHPGRAGSPQSGDPFTLDRGDGEIKHGVIGAVVR